MANNRLDKSKRALALSLLMEGSTVNGICRVLTIGKPALLRFIQECGQACEQWHNRHFVGLRIEQLQIDEQWSYVHTHKERMSEKDKALFPDRGDSWLWVGLDRKSKAAIGWRTGKRNGLVANDLLCDLAKRIDGELDICTDQLNSYEFGIAGAFGSRASHVQILKEFAGQAVANEQLKKPVNRLLGIRKVAISGNPNMGAASTSHIERFFLTTRQNNKRKARKTLAYSKKWSTHALVNSIHLFLYNMVRKHEALKEAPAVVLGVIKKRWSLEQVVTMTEEFLKRREEEAFDAAFQGFQTKPKARLVYKPVAPKTPWYLDPESGGPNPSVRKEGVAYEGESEFS